jgi:hypothetical protein
MENNKIEFTYDGETYVADLEALRDELRKCDDSNGSSSFRHLMCFMRDYRWAYSRGNSELEEAGYSEADQDVYFGICSFISKKEDNE